MALVITCGIDEMKSNVSLSSRYCTIRSRVVNGPTSSGPNPARTRKYKPEAGQNPKTNLKPKSCSKKNESYVRSEKFSYVAELF